MRGSILDSDTSNGMVARGQREEPAHSGQESRSFPDDGKNKLVTNRIAPGTDEDAAETPATSMTLGSCPDDNKKVSATNDKNMEAGDDAIKTADTESSSAAVFRRARQLLMAAGAVLAGAALANLVLIFLLTNAYAEFEKFHSFFPVIGWLYLTALLIVAIAVGTLVWKSWCRYRILCNVSQLQELSEQYQGQSAVDQESRKKFAKYLRHTFQDIRKSKERSSLEVIKVRVDSREKAHELQKKLEESGENSQIGDFKAPNWIKLTSEMNKVLEPLDKQADAIIEKRAAQVAVATALASRSFDLLIVTWQSVRLIDEISQVYAGRPGFLGTLKLVRGGMAAIVFAQVSDLVADVAVNALAQKALAYIGGRMVEGAANGIVMLRLGEAIKQQCRPVRCTGSTTSPVKRLRAVLKDKSVNMRSEVSTLQT